MRDRLTDDTIRENWLKYNHPDGPQPTSYGIALPKWVVEGKNNIWVLGAYGIVFGGALPALVGRWWFGNRQKTKDGINAQSAAAFFKSLKEESTIEEVVGTLGKAYKWESTATKGKESSELDTLEKAVAKSASTRWAEVRKLAQDFDGKLHETRRKALVLLYAHLLRLKITDSGLKKGWHISFGSFCSIIQSAFDRPNSTTAPIASPPQCSFKCFCITQLACAHSLRHAATSFPHTSSPS